MRSISKANKLHPQRLYNLLRLQALPPHFPPGDTTISLSSFYKKSMMDGVPSTTTLGPPHSAGSGSTLLLCLSLTLREFHLFFIHRCSSFRFFNDMNKRLQVFFRFDYGGNATKRLQCHNLLTPNLLSLFQAWCH